MQLPCPSCNFPTLETYFYCPNCGKQLKKRPPSTSIGKQISLYLFSVFFPPFGIIPAIRYLSQADSKSKIVGTAALALTAISIIVTVILTMNIISQVQQTFQLQQNMYQGLGY